MPSPLTTLRLARALIADEKRWCRGVSARDKHGQHVSALAQEACRWCASGALVAVNKDDLEPASKALDELEHVISAEIRHGLDLPMFNDTRTHAEVLALFDWTIDKLDRLERRSPYE